MDAIHPLRAYRDQKKLTQKELADLLDVERETVARWETGLRDPDQGLLPKITAVTGIPATVLRPDLAKLLNPEEAAQ